MKIRDWSLDDVRLLYFLIKTHKIYWKLSRLAV